jgi:lycopene beta-cyclase
LTYDYIISGSGAAGMSLLYRMLHLPFFKEKKILVVDKEPKNTNDHTWCFWENKTGVFEEIVHHQWKNVQFYSNYFSGLLDLDPYSYKMIRSIDLYGFVMREAAKNSNVTFLYGHVTAVSTEGNTAVLLIDNKRHEAHYIFNSILFHKYKVPHGKHHLLQHFKGLVIETDVPVFNEAVATLMDFRVSQNHGTTFMYVLPVASNRALIEYTLFTSQLLQTHEYTAALQEYIQQVLHIESYKVIEEEFGIIPMTNIHFEKHQGKVINMGTAGGNTKPSTGYTFQFIQKQCDEIIDGLMNEKLLLKKSFTQKKFHWYDSVLLNVLSNNRMAGDLIFSKMFQKNKPHQVLKFLDNESSLAEDIKIITSLPILPFLKAGIQEMIS